jgi:hypothetical protein
VRLFPIQFSIGRLLENAGEWFEKESSSSLRPVRRRQWRIPYTKCENNYWWRLKRRRLVFARSLFECEANALAGLERKCSVFAGERQAPVQPVHGTAETATGAATEQMHAQAQALEPGQGTFETVGDEKGYVAAGKHG